MATARSIEALKKKLRRNEQERLSQDGHKLIAHWISDAIDDKEMRAGNLIELVGYRALREVLPDKVVENLERARLARDGRIPMLTAGSSGGYEELINVVLADGTAIASSAAETRIFGAIKIGAYYMQPYGIPGRTLRIRMRGRQTTLTTTATATFRTRIAATDIITGNILCASGAITADAAAQTATMWKLEEEIVTRTVGTAGTVQAMGDVEMASAALTVANQQAVFMGSAGSATPSTQTWDTTVDQFLEQTFQWSLATAYSLTGHEYLLESLN